VDVAFEFDGNEYLLPQGQLLAENLRGYAVGNFPNDVQEITESPGVAPDWLDGARTLADAIEATLTGGLTGPVRLNERKAADAAHAALLPIVHAADPPDDPPGAAALLDALGRRGPRGAGAHQ
jgi:hypothetical protein